MKRKYVIFTAAAVGIAAIAAAVILGMPVIRSKFDSDNDDQRHDVQQGEDKRQTVLKIEERVETRVITDDDGRVMINMSISLPKIDGDSEAAEVINQYYEGIYQKSIIRGEDELSEQAEELYAEIPEIFTPFNFSQMFMVKTNNEKYIAIARSTDEHTGGVHGNYVISFDNFNPQTGAKLMLSDLFSAASEQYSEVIYSEIERLAKQNDSSEYYEGYENQLRSALDLEDFFVEESGITFVYQIYAIAPFAAGEQYFTVPFEAFGDMLKPEVMQFAAQEDTAEQN